MGNNYKKIRERCRKGIPASVRPRAWLFLCGGHLLMKRKPELFSKYASQEGDPRWVEDIRKDLHRQFPYHEMFMSQDGYGQQDLLQVLKAFSILNPEIGYCQAQAPLAAFLLMHMPAEQAFWCLVAVCEKYLTGYYSQGMVSQSSHCFSLCQHICFSWDNSVLYYSVRYFLLCCQFLEKIQFYCTLKIRSTQFFKAVQQIYR